MWDRRGACGHVRVCGCVGVSGWVEPQQSVCATLPQHQNKNKSERTVVVVGVAAPPVACWLVATGGLLLSLRMAVLAGVVGSPEPATFWVPGVFCCVSSGEEQGAGRETWSSARGGHLLPTCPVLTLSPANTTMMATRPARSTTLSAAKPSRRRVVPRCCWPSPPAPPVSAAIGAAAWLACVCALCSGWVQPRWVRCMGRDKAGLAHVMGGLAHF